MKNYDTFELEDFVADEAFCRWVLYPNEGLDAELRGFMEKHPEKKDLLEEARLLVANLRFEEAPPDNTQVSRIWERIEASTAGSKKVPFWNPVRLSLALAAGLALLLAIYLVFSPAERITYAAAPGETIELTLPDGSRVVLNAGSQLSYNRTGWKEGSRAVELDGEAYFSVSKGQGTFTVNSALGYLTVLGTKFNVLDRGEKWEVRVFEGRVAVEAVGASQVELTQGYLSHYDKTQASIRVDTFRYELEQYRDWKSGYFYYDVAALKTVIEEIGRQYNKKVDFDTELLGLTFTGPFRKADLDQTLEEILFPYRDKLKYSVDAEAIVIEKK